jgi:hypothetical protein
MRPWASAPGGRGQSVWSISAAPGSGGASLVMLQISGQRDSVGSSSLEA